MLVWAQTSSGSNSSSGMFIGMLLGGWTTMDGVAPGGDRGRPLGPLCQRSLLLSPPTLSAVGTALHRMLE